MSSEAVLKPQPEGIPLPFPSSVSEPHWEGCKRGELMVQRCLDCEGYVFIPQPACTHCLSENMEWVQSSGKGVIHTFAIVHRGPTPPFRDRAPYVPVIVELEEGPRMPSNLVECEPDPENIKVGMAVEVVFQALDDNITIPYFRPAQ